jgi:hypothetical protein
MLDKTQIVRMAGSPNNGPHRDPCETRSTQFQLNALGRGVACGRLRILIDLLKAFFYPPEQSVHRPLPGDAAAALLTATI